MRHAAALPLLLAGSLLLAGCAGEAEPATSPTAATPSTTGEPTPTPTPSPTSVASPEPADGAGGPVLLLGPDGAIGDLTPGSPASSTVAEVSAVLGAEPTQSADGVACATTGQPGTQYRWDRFTLIVRTTDDEGAPAEPYAVGWVVPALGASATGVTYRSFDGVELADTVADVQAAHPGIEGGPWVDESMWVWTPEGSTLTYFTEDGAAASSVIGMASGAWCGD